MTLEEVKGMDRETITPTIAGRVLGCNPYSISVQAKTDPDALGFPVVRVGNRTLIPRRAFIAFLEGKE